MPDQKPQRPAIRATAKPRVSRMTPKPKPPRAPFTTPHPLAAHSLKPGTKR